MCTQLAREKLKTQEDSLRLAVQKGRLHRSLGTAEQELAEAQKHIQVLRVGAPGHGTWPRAKPSAALWVQAGAPWGAACLLGAPSFCRGMVLGCFWGLLHSGRCWCSQWGAAGLFRAPPHLRATQRPVLG